MSLEQIRNKNKAGKFDRLLKAAGRTSIGKRRENYEQEETYYPERDKSGNGSAIIRFLPGLESEDFPYYIERFQHGFKHKNRWYINFCPTTINKECPVCDYNFDVIKDYGDWANVPVDVQNEVRQRGRTSGYSAGNYCNILVIKDPANPENEGKVHLFSFGKAIVDMIMGAANPKDNGIDETPEPVDVFDLVEGANFKFIIRKKDGRADYSHSSFEKPSPCPKFNEDDQFPLFPLVDEEKFKSYEELSDEFNKVMSSTSRSRTAERDSEEQASRPSRGGKRSTKVETEPDDLPEPDVTGGSDSEDNMAYFQNLVDEIDI